MELSFATEKSGQAVGFIQRLFNREREIDFSPEYKTIGLKSSSLCQSKIRPINGTVKDKKTVFTPSVKLGIKLNALTLQANIIKYPISNICM
jgi:hypothetical protein